MAKKQLKQVSNKEKQHDIVFKIDKFTGRIPTAKPGDVIHGDKFNKKKQRSDWKKKLKEYM